MKFYTLSLSLFFSISPLLGSDYLTIDQQNTEMERAFSKKEKPIVNNPQLQNALRELTKPNDFTKQIFPHQNLTSNHSSSVMTLNSWEQIRKHAAETMFHRLNDALNFVLTNREILLSAILKNPKFIGLTCYTIGQGYQGELYFDFPLLSAYHPVANLAQGYLALKEHQYWIDILLLFKNTVFPQHTLSPYDHNAASAIKELIQGQISILEEKINAQSKNSINLSQVIDQIDDHDVSFFVKADHSFHDLLKGCLKSIDDALPKGTVTQINTSKAIYLKNKGHVLDLGKNKRESVFENLSPQINQLHAYFSKNYTAILTGIRSIAIMEHITTNFTPEEANEIIQSPFYAAANRECMEHLQQCNYNMLFNGLNNNAVSVQKIRRELGLPNEIFKGLNFTKGMQKALKDYQADKQQMLMKQLPSQEAGVIIEIRTEAEQRNSNTKETHIQLKSEPKSIQNLEQIDSFAIQDTKISDIAEKSTENEEENCVFDSSYFKLIHQYHQGQKNQNTTNIQSKRKLSEYETNLYSYLMDTIFRPKQRPTWSTLASSLAELGFKGKPNTSGNGSTWEFSVTEKNELFFMDVNYKGATFNVHEFKGNEPIHPKYLKFFQSGFSNVFGLTEEYIGIGLGV